MTAKEKFEKRIQEEGLWDAWAKNGFYGRVAKQDDEIILFIHESDDDEYSEIHYPTFNDLRYNISFVDKCKKEFYCHSDEKFVCELANWLEGFEKCCPLYPVDVYFPADGLETSFENFKDDEIVMTNSDIQESFVRKSYDGVSYTEAYLLIAMYGWKTLCDYLSAHKELNFELNGFDGETKLIESWAEEFYSMYYRFDFSKNRTSVYEEAQEFIVNKLTYIQNNKDAYKDLRYDVATR